MAIEGTYVIPVQTPKGPTEITIELKMEGNSLCGSTKAFNAAVPFRGGSVDGNGFQFMVSESMPSGSIDLDYSGSVVGNKITGQVITPWGTKPFEGTRV